MMKLKYNFSGFVKKLIHCLKASYNKHLKLIEIIYFI